MGDKQQQSQNVCVPPKEVISCEAGLPKTWDSNPSVQDDLDDNQWRQQADQDTFMQELMFPDEATCIEPAEGGPSHYPPVHDPRGRGGAGGAPN